MSTLQNIDQTSIVYIEHYLDVVENLPSSIARVMSRIHEIDIKRTKIASLIDASLQNYLRNVSYFFAKLFSHLFMFVIFLL